MKQLLYSILVAVMLFAATTISAKTINLYSEPKADSKVASVMDADAGVTIVYTPKSGEWIKVANPSNGDVGWIKFSELGGKGYNMRVFTSDNGAHSYSVYQFGSGNNQFNQKQLKNEMQHFEQQQRMMQAHIAHVFNDMFYFPQPIFVPIVVVPELQKTSSAKAAHNSKTQTK